MSFLNLPAALGALGFGLCLFGGKAGAESSAGDPQTNAPTARVSLKTVEVIGGTNAKPLQRVFLTAGTNKFAFLVPGDFRVDASAPTRIVMNSPQYGCFIFVRFTEHVISENAAAKAGSWRSKVLSEFPGAVITSEFAMNAANSSGSAFEFEWTNSGGARQQACTVFLPFGTGIVQFVLLTDSDRYVEGRYFFHSVLLGFRSNETGPLEIPPLLGNS